MIFLINLKIFEINIFFLNNFSKIFSNDNTFYRYF